MKWDANNITTSEEFDLNLRQSDIGEDKTLCGLTEITPATFVRQRYLAQRLGWHLCAFHLDVFFSLSKEEYS